MSIFSLDITAQSHRWATALPRLVSKHPSFNDTLLSVDAGRNAGENAVATVGENSLYLFMTVYRGVLVWMEDGTWNGAVQQQEECLCMFASQHFCLSEAERDGTSMMMGKIRDNRLTRHPAPCWSLSPTPQVIPWRAWTESWEKQFC